MTLAGFNLLAIAAEGSEASVLTVSGRMVILTWVAFILALISLYWVAWKPILRALDKRERTIRKSLEDAEATQKASEAARAAQKAQADKAAEDIRALMETARQNARTLAASIEAQAQDAARRHMETAQAEIGRQRERALIELQQESARLAEDAAARILAARASDREDALNAWIQRDA